MIRASGACEGECSSNARQPAPGPTNVAAAMTLRKIHITNLKRLRDFSIDFTRDGEPRMWTVLIGPNGTGKTTILQAIALAAAGCFRADELVSGLRESLPDKRLMETVTTQSGPIERSVEVVIRAEFELRFGRERLASAVLLRADGPVLGGAEYVDERGVSIGPVNENPGQPWGDPLWGIREKNIPKLFVVGYGVQRDLPVAAPVVQPAPRPSIDRLRPLFAPQALVGPNFSAVFADERSRVYARVLKEVLLRAEGMVPDLVDLELRGRGGVRRPDDLTETHRFVQRVSGHDLKLPARWLSHGYQSSLAWLSDLVGQILLEGPLVTMPSEIEGVVLIDEIDLYLHPTWQVGLVQALRATFPCLQFVVTTHSPILLNAFRRDEVVRLGFDDEGNVVRVPLHRDPRLLTGGELYEEFFGITDIYPTDLARLVDAWRSLAMNPDRSADDDLRLDEYESELRREGFPLRPRVARREHTPGAA